MDKKTLIRRAAALILSVLVSLSVLACMEVIRWFMSADLSIPEETATAFFHGELATGLTVGIVTLVSLVRPPSARTRKALEQRTPCT